MVCNMSPKIYKDEQLQSEVIHNLTSAWTYKPTKKIIQSLWGKINKSEGNEAEFLDILEQIHKHLVPESLSLSVTVAQKIYALTRLNELSINGTEPQLQTLLENFPWILGSDKGKITANLSLKELAKEAVKKGLISTHGEAAKDLAKQPDSGLRPDFSFFANENKTIILVVELKSPQTELTKSHLMQLHAYIYWLENHFPDATVNGCLIGRVTNSVKKQQTANIDVLTWNDICLKSRKDYLELLAAMLHGVSEYYDDSRIQDVIEFGGEPTRELLGRISDANTELKEVFDRIDSKIKGKAKKITKKNME